MLLFAAYHPAVPGRETGLWGARGAGPQGSSLPSRSLGLLTREMGRWQGPRAVERSDSCHPWGWAPAMCSGQLCFLPFSCLAVPRVKQALLILVTVHGRGAREGPRSGCREGPGPGAGLSLQLLCKGAAAGPTCLAGLWSWLPHLAGGCAQRTLCPQPSLLHDHSSATSLCPAACLSLAPRLPQAPSRR